MGEAVDGLAPDALLESTDPEGEADRPLVATDAFEGLDTPLGILLPIRPLFSVTFREAAVVGPNIPADFGSSEGIRFPTRPR
jgi:hypothetical protein